MTRIDTSSWKLYTVSDLFEKLDLRIKSENFDKRIDTSLGQTKEFSLPLVNAKDGNNGIMYYGREKDFDTAEMCLDIVQNGAIATGNVYAQIGKTGVLWDAYLIKPKFVVSGHALLFLSRVMHNVIKQKFSYDNKAIWDKVKQEKIPLPTSQDGLPDFAYMEQYMESLESRVKSSVNHLLDIIGGVSIST